MKFVPNAISRKVADQKLLARKNSPTILFVIGVGSMVGDAVLACRAALKLEETLERNEADKKQAQRVKDLGESEDYTGEQNYAESEMRNDLTIIVSRGVVKVVKLYAPS